MTQTLSRLLSLFDSPGELFDEVVAGPPRLTHWLVPILLAAITSLLLLAATHNRQLTATRITEMLNAGEISSAQSGQVTTNWDRTSAMTVCLGAMAGTLWSAAVLWLIGRFLLRSQFSFAKAVEVAGLASLVVALGSIVTALLIVASGDAAARPALSLMVHGLAPDHPLRPVLDAFNGFYLWATALLALGLSRLSRVSLKQSAFWVFGYWLMARLAGLLLAC